MLLMDCRPSMEPSGLPKSSIPHVNSSLPAWTYRSAGAASSSRQDKLLSTEHTVALPGSSQSPEAFTDLFISEASSSGRDLSECHSSACMLTGFSTKPAVFTGAFAAPGRGAADAFLQRLAECIKVGIPQTHAAAASLAAAVQSCLQGDHACPGLSGCAVIVSSSSISFCSIGTSLLALGTEEKAQGLAGSDLLSMAKGNCLQPTHDGSLPQEVIVQRSRSAFGSLIPMERASLAGNSPIQLQQGSCELRGSHRLLILGAGSPAGSLKASEAVAHISRPQRTHQEHSAALLAAKCQQEFATASGQAEAEAPVSIAVLDLQNPVAAPAQLAASGEPEAVTSSPDSPTLRSRQEPMFLPRLLLSPSGRRVHFLEPIQGCEDRDQAEGRQQPLEHAADRSSEEKPMLQSQSSGSPESVATPSSGFPDGSSFLSSGSLLSQPNMSIPEDTALPEAHSARQMPPPLLAPVRKAYPSGSQELYITPEMLSDISPVRKAKLGRAASMNSPEGLRPLPPEAEPQLHGSSSSSSVLGSRSRGTGEEGRVRGGLPRISSVPSFLPGTQTPSPTASTASSPGTACRHESTPFQQRQELPLLSDFLSNKAQRPQAVKPTSWNLLTSRSGSGQKTRGQTAALRLLRASSNVTSPSSAPANIGRLETSANATSSSELDNDVQVASSGTESLSTHSTAGSGSSRRSAVRRVPLLEEPPTQQIAELALPPQNLGDPEDQENHMRSIQKASMCRQQQECQASSNLQPKNIDPIVPQVAEKTLVERANDVLWPPSTNNFDEGPKLEGRQHSGEAFQSQSSADRLMDPAKP